MKNIGASIIGVADLENRKIKFSTLFSFSPVLTEAHGWECRAYNGDNTVNDTESAKISISSDGVFSYDADVSTSGNIYIKVYCTAQYYGTVLMQHLDYWFRFKELLG